MAWSCLCVLATVAHATHGATTSFEALGSWIAREGGLIGSIAVETRDGLRGLHATCSVPAGESLLAVPRHCTLWAKEGDGLKAHEQLILRLLECEVSGDLSYVQEMLPKQVTLLRDWSDEQLDALQSPTLREEVECQRQWLDSTCQRLLTFWCRRGWSKEQFPSVQRCKWAESIVRSRSLDITSESDGGNVLAIVPLFDLCNHQRLPPTNDLHASKQVEPEHGDSERDPSRAPPVLVTADGVIVLCARTPLHHGNEVFIDYGGEGGNARLLLDYGFAELHEEDPGCERIHLGDYLGPDLAHVLGGPMSISLGTASLDEQAILAVRDRLMLDEAASLVESTGSCPQATDLSLRSEQTSWSEQQVASMLQRMCVETLANMPTSEQEDRDELKSLQQDADDSSFRLAMALRYRIGQKRALRWTAQCLNEALANANAGEKWRPVLETLAESRYSAPFSKLSVI